MESLRELYRIGPGPSSSHSLGVRNACEYYYGKYPDGKHYTVELYGSLSLTGKGHMSDKVIYDFFGPDKRWLDDDIQIVTGTILDFLKSL